MVVMVGVQVQVVPVAAAVVERRTTMTTALLTPVALGQVAAPDLDPARRIMMVMPPTQMQMLLVMVAARAVVKMVEPAVAQAVKPAAAQVARPVAARVAKPRRRLTIRKHKTGQNA